MPVLKVGVGRRIIIPKKLAKQYGIKDGGYVNIRILSFGNTVEEAVLKSRKPAKKEEKPKPQTQTGF
jgi:bifunctional DNA-binding transcriptional regulator/antitoxin component of YhaV-PrlF toxin-antitoxin module